MTAQSTHDKKLRTLRTAFIRKTAIAGVGAAAAGIIVQMLGGADYPPVPPGAVLLALSAGLFAVRTRWTPFLGVAIPLFLTFGAFVTPNAGDHLSRPGAVLVFAGTVIQLVGMAVGDVCGLTVAVLSQRKEQSA